MAAFKYYVIYDILIQQYRTMELTERQSRLPPRQNYQVNFEHFKRSTNQPLICDQASEQNINSGQLAEWKLLRKHSNSILVLLGYLYIGQAIRTGSVADLDTQVKNDIQIAVEEIIEWPLQFQRYTNKNTIIATLHAGFNKITKEARFCDKYRELEDIMTRIFNEYHFFTVCVAAWLRCKALLHYRSNPQFYEHREIGNQEILIKNYSKDLRHLALEMVCQAVNVRLTIKSGKLNEIYQPNNLAVECILHTGVGHYLFTILQQKDKSERVDTAYSESENVEARDRQKSEISQIFSNENQVICRRCQRPRQGRFCICRKRNISRVEAPQLKATTGCKNCGNEYIANEELCRQCAERRRRNDI